MSRKIARSVGFANLSGADFASFLSEDLAAVSALFETTNIATARQIPTADILFLYTRFSTSGALDGTPDTGVRQVAQESRFEDSCRGLTNTRRHHSKCHEFSWTKNG